MSENKKDPFQFTIRFNKDLAKHVVVARYLNLMGRSKAQIIAEAVLMYIRQDQKGVPVMASELPDIQQTFAAPADRNKEEPEKKSNVIETDELDDFDDGDLQAIMESMQFMDELSD